MSQRADYARSSKAPLRPGGVIASVDAGGPAARAGLAPGDVVTHAEDALLRDVIDWRWHSDGASVRVSGLRADGTPLAVSLERVYPETWGFDFAEPLFDAIRTCSNRCEFCFMSQLPKSMRRSLYVRDDDFRLSFLQGNFVTLTNLTDEDVERIVEQRLSPLNVSLHVVDPEVRGRLICARDDRALEHVDALLDAGIDLHAQVVVVPGVNDGTVLDETLAWLAEREGVLSVGIVPVGYTGHQSAIPRSYEEPAAAGRVLEQIAEWASAYRAEHGLSWVYAADELYLNAGATVPPAQDYDGFPQLENGIGLVRVLADSLAERAAELAAATAAVAEAGAHAVLVTGELAAPLLRDFVGGVDSGGCVEVLAVKNEFFGGNVSVAGLLTAADVLGALGERGHGVSGEVADRQDADRPRTATTFLLPDVMFNFDGLTLDDCDAARMAAMSGKRLRLVSCDADGLLAGLASAAVASESVLDPKSR